VYLHRDLKQRLRLLPHFQSFNGLKSFVLEEVMGIYSDDKIYGIRFILDGNNLFEQVGSELTVGDERISQKSLTFEEIQKARLFFESLTAEEKAEATIFVYNSSVSTYSINSQPTMHWIPSKIFQ
jgi:hypothetical protein